MFNVHIIFKCLDVINYQKVILLLSMVGQVSLEDSNLALAMLNTSESDQQ